MSDPFAVPQLTMVRNKGILCRAQDLMKKTMAEGDTFTAFVLEPYLIKALQCKDNLIQVAKLCHILDVYLRNYAKYGNIYGNQELKPENQMCPVCGSRLIKGECVDGCSRR